MSDWRPIKSAPKDGTFILLFGNQHKHNLVNFGGKIVFSGYWDAIDSAWCSHGSTAMGPFYSPTHWMPLPAPPSQRMTTTGHEGE
jgi:hypothetical protein